jgi:hypothetical protein
VFLRYLRNGGNHNKTKRVSIKQKGEIKKLILFTESNLRGYFNLGFGDFDEKTSKIDDAIASDNGDSVKVLSTVAYSVILFFEENPNAFFFIIGSNSVRTRLYRMSISNNIKEIGKDYGVLGLLNNEWCVFEKNVHYDAFLINKNL